MEKIMTGFEVVDPHASEHARCICSEGSTDMGWYEGWYGCQCGCKGESSGADNHMANYGIAYRHPE